MTKMCVTAAFAAILAIMTVSLSFAGASCCDPANAAGIQGAGPAQVGAARSAPPAVPTNPGSQGIAAFMGYGKPEGVRLSDLAPRGGCCANPNASCAARANAAGQQPLQGPAVGCAAGCCGPKNSAAQPTQAAGQARVRPIQAVAPLAWPAAPVSELGPSMTAAPVKSDARPKPTGSGGLW